jgi:trigger factor
MEGVSNKEELEKVVEEEIKAQKEREADNKFIEDLLEKASKNMKVEIDEEIIDAETDRMYKNFIEKLKMQGVTEELYFAKKLKHNSSSFLSIWC